MGHSTLEKITVALNTDSNLVTNALIHKKKTFGYFYSIPQGTNFGQELRENFFVIFSFEIKN